MKKVVIVVAFACLLFLPVVSASLSLNMAEVERYVNEYKSGSLNAPQLVVNIEYVKSKMYEELDKEDRNSFTEAEIEAVFEKTDFGEEDRRGRKDKRFTQYERKFKTDDFHVVFRADSFFRHDKEYYEKRETTAANYYVINYELVAVNVASSDLSNELTDFISDLNVFIGQGEVVDKEYEEMGKRLGKIKQKFHEMRSQDNCVEVAESIGMEEDEKDYPSKERHFYYLIEEVTRENCWNEPKCDWICDSVEVCGDCEQECHEEEACKEECVEIFNNETNETESVCEEVCSMQEVCSGCEDICRTKENCYNKCEDTEHCDVQNSGEIGLEVSCRGEKNNLWLRVHGEEFEYYQGLNEGGEWGCGSEIQSLVNMRKVLQKDFNQEFAEWYFEEYLIEDYDRMINGDNGFRYVLELLTRNEEQIGQNLHCSETGQWPEGFEKIDITYINENTHVEVWEKYIPVEHDQTTYYTTLYKYSWMPSRDLLKELINYKLSETDTFGPSAKDVARIKSDVGQMELINSLSKRYGGSFDVKLELRDKEDQVVLKYFQINPDVIVKFVDSIEGKPDISVKVEYNALYDFINYVSYETEGDKIKGPHWVHMRDDGGPGKFFSVVGAVRKAWREGVTIKPRHALLKLLFNSRSIIGLMGSSNAEADYYGGETVKINEKVVEQEW